MVQELFHTMIDIVQENSHKNILEKDILQSPEKNESPKKNFHTESNECFTAGIIKLDNASKVDEKDE